MGMVIPVKIVSEVIMGLGIMRLINQIFKIAEIYPQIPMF
jgi:hypothetical protein